MCMRACVSVQVCVCARVLVRVHARMCMYLGGRLCSCACLVEGVHVRAYACVDLIHVIIYFPREQ